MSGAGFRRSGTSRFVTGSSRGLGSAIARRLARDGLAVAVNDLCGEERTLEVVAAIRDEGGFAEAFTADVTESGRSPAW